MHMNIAVIRCTVKIRCKDGVRVFLILREALINEIELEFPKEMASTAEYLLY